MSSEKQIKSFQKRNISMNSNLKNTQTNYKFQSVSMIRELKNNNKNFFDLMKKKKKKFKKIPTFNDIIKSKSKVRKGKTKSTNQSLCNSYLK